MKHLTHQIYPNFATETQIRETLIHIREQVICPSYPQRDTCILRRRMIDAFIQIKPTSVYEVLSRFPRHLIEKTDETQIDNYLASIIMMLTSSQRPS